MSHGYNKPSPEIQVALTGIATTTGSGDTFAVTHPFYAAGGWKYVADLTERDAIEHQRRIPEITWAYVASNDSWYQLQASPESPTGILNTDWVLRGTDPWAAATDGDKGDVIVSGNGASWIIENGAITNAKAADMAQNTIKGRISAGTGDSEDLTAEQVRTIIGLTGSNGITETDGDLKLGGTLSENTTLNPDVKGSHNFSIGTSGNEVNRIEGYINDFFFIEAGDYTADTSYFNMSKSAWQAYGETVGGRLYDINGSLATNKGIELYMQDNTYIHTPTGRPYRPYHQLNNAKLTSILRTSVLLDGYTGIEIDNTGILITDNFGSNGAQYAADYSANNASNPRWIPDKAYVDGVSGTVTGTNGLTRSGNDIKLGGTLSETTIIDGGGNVLRAINAERITLQSEAETTHYSEVEVFKNGDATIKSYNPTTFNSTAITTTPDVGISIIDANSSKGASYAADYRNNNLSNPRWIPDLNAVQLEANALDLLRKYTETKSNASITVDVAFPVTHNLNDTDILIQLWDIATGEAITAKYNNRTVNSVDITFVGSKPTGDVRIIVKK